MSRQPETVKVGHPSIEGEEMIINREDYDPNVHGEIVEGRATIKPDVSEQVEVTAENVGAVTVPEIEAQLEKMDSSSEEDLVAVKAMLDAESTGKGRATAMDALQDFLDYAE